MGATTHLGIINMTHQSSISGLQTSGKFFFEKTDTCDVAPYPSAETFQLLQELYANDGPIDLAYRSHGVAYVETQFLRIIGGELFVDRERELQSLFPSHSYFTRADYTPKPARIKGFLTSLRNTAKLQKIDGDLGEFSARLRAMLDRKLTTTTIEEAKEEFFDDYETIFAINLIVGNAIAQLQRSLPKEISIAEALSYFPEGMPLLWDAPIGLRGNTLELTDVGEFMSNSIERVSKNIPSTIPRELLQNVQYFLRLREYGRWVAIRHINHLRLLYPPIAAPKVPITPLPTVITDQRLPIAPIKSVGVSSGIATGPLVDAPTKGGILVVPSLTPALVQCIPILAGVIADHGSIMSHFAIVAREMGLPVVVKYPIKTLLMGANVTIDGGAGTVRAQET